MEHDLKISDRKEKDVIVLQLEGDVTAKTGKTIEDTYRKVSMDGVKKILLLFNNENYINSGGIASLILIASESKKRDQKIFMTGISDHFQKIFEMTGLLKYIKFYPSEESALADFD
jgi:anti-anti-sigma factor